MRIKYSILCAVGPGAGNDACSLKPSRVPYTRRGTVGQALSLLHAIKPYLAWYSLRVNSMLHDFDAHPNTIPEWQQQLDQVQAPPILR